MQIDGFRLSPLQRRLWAHHSKRAGPFRVQRVASLEGPLERDALRAALSDVASRYDILRTGFADVPGLTVPVQVIADEANWELADVAIQHGEKGARESILAELRSGSLAQLTLGDGPQLEARLFEVLGGLTRIIRIRV